MAGFADLLAVQGVWLGGKKPTTVGAPSVVIYVDRRKQRESRLQKILAMIAAADAADLDSERER